MSPAWFRNVETAFKIGSTQWALLKSFKFDKNNVLNIELGPNDLVVIIIKTVLHYRNQLSGSPWLNNQISQISEQAKLQRRNYMNVKSVDVDLILRREGESIEQSHTIKMKSNRY